MLCVAHQRRRISIQKLVRDEKGPRDNEGE